MVILWFDLKRHAGCFRLPLGPMHVARQAPCDRINERSLPTAISTLNRNELPIELDA